MKKGLVSIIVACYNGEKYIERCFNCILSQTYKNIEVIFGDDGSIDNSYDFATSFVDRFEQQQMTLKCFSQTNIGMVTNNALSMAEGEYIAVYDVDDILYPESIRKRVDMLNSNKEYACVRTNGYKRDENGNKHLFVTDPEEKSKEYIFEDILFGRTNNWAGSYMVRHKALDDVYKGECLFETRYGANLQVLMAVAYNNKSGFIDEPLMEYMYNVGSITRSDFNYEAEKKRFLGFKAIREAVLRQLRVIEKYQRLVDELYNRILLDLDISYNKSSEYIQHYESCLSHNMKPALIYDYYYYKFKGNRRKAIISRLKNIFLCRLR